MPRNNKYYCHHHLVFLKAERVWRKGEKVKQAKRHQPIKFHAPRNKIKLAKTNSANALCGATS